MSKWSYLSIKDQGHSLTFDQGHSDVNIKTKFLLKIAGQIEVKFHMKLLWVGKNEILFSWSQSYDQGRHGRHDQIWK